MVAKIRSSARDVPEIHIGEVRPLIPVQLADVDYESVVERAKSRTTPVVGGGSSAPW